MQEAIVALIVVCASWMVARRYLPKSFKSNLRLRAAHALRRFGWENAAHRLEEVPEAAPNCATGCGSCGGCDARDAGLSQSEFAITRDSWKRASRK